MSTLSSINSLLSSLPLSTQDSSSTNDTAALAQTSDSSLADTVSLSSESQVQSLLSSLGSESTGSDDSSSSLYDVLLSAENTEILKNNPGLVKMIAAVDQADTTSGTSSSTGSGTSAAINDINLITMSPSDLLSLVQQYNALSSSTASTAPSSTTDETA
jgi:hypothetical protein